jgi:hypothetical protein
MVSPRPPAAGLFLVFVALWFALPLLGRWHADHDD